jgi:hypothetical protein
MNKNNKNNQKHDHGENKPLPKWVERLFGIIHNCWQYHAPCSHINMQAWWDDQLETPCWQIKAAPVYQEVYGGDEDGKRVWAGFIFDVMDFSRAPGVWVQEQAVASYCQECTAYPKMMLRGKFQGHLFFLHVYLEPIEETETIEIIDTIKQEIRDMPPVPTKDE